MSINNLITIKQFVLRTGHSTELAVIQLVDHLTKQMDIGKVPTNIYIYKWEVENNDLASHLFT